MGLVPIRFQGLQVHARQRAYHFQMTELFGTDIHQHVFSIRILTIQTLYGILHGRGQFAIRSAKLLQ